MNRNYKFEYKLSWCLNPTQDQKDKLEEIKDEPHKGCVAAKGLIELIEGLPLEDYRVLPQSNRSMLVKRRKRKTEGRRKCTGLSEPYYPLANRKYQQQ